MDFSLDFNGRPLLFLDTPGHARHHYCIFDERYPFIFHRGYIRHLLS